MRAPAAKEPCDESTVAMEKKPASLPPTRSKVRFCHALVESTAGVHSVSGSLAMTLAEKTASPSWREVQVAPHVSSVLRASVSATWKKGASFTSVTLTVTVAEADMPPPSFAVTRSAKSFWFASSKLSSAAALSFVVSAESQR